MKEKFKEHKKLYIPILIIVVLAICAVIGYNAKVKYDQKQEKIRAERIETKNKEISNKYKGFEKEEDRTKKLETVKSIEKEYNQYKKSETVDKECVTEYEKNIKSMKKFFTDDYDNSIKTISDAVDEDRVSEYNVTIDEKIKSYNARVEEIKKKEKEEADKKAAEEAEKAKQQAEAESANTANANNSSSDSGYVDNGSSSYDYSYDNSGSYSGDYSYSSGNSGSNSGGSSYSESYGSYVPNSSWRQVWGSEADGSCIIDNITGSIYDGDTGEYGGNIRDWLDLE